MGILVIDAKLLLTCHEHSRCNPGGTSSCIPKVGDYECECKNGFSGSSCSDYEIPNDLNDDFNLVFI